MRAQVQKVFFTITNPKTGSQNAIDKSQTSTSGKRVLGGVNSPTLGAEGPHERCITCGETSQNCPGHAGHIKLPERIVWPAYLGSHLLGVLTATCPDGHFLLDTVEKNTAAKDDKLRHKLESIKAELRTLIKANNGVVSGDAWRIMIDAVRNVHTCGVCGKIQPKRYFIGTKNEMYDVFQMDANNVSTRLSPDDIYKHLSMIPREAMFYLGFRNGHPSHMVTKTVVVPPTCIRPSSISGNQTQRQEDDLSATLVNIVKHRDNLESVLNSIVAGSDSSDKDSRLSNARLMLYYSIDSLTRTLTERIRGKHGRVRGNLAGKRVDYSARSVIYAEPDIGIDEIGLPLSIAQSQMTPEIVSVNNIETLRKLVVSGPNNYPGARQVIKASTGFTFALKHDKPDTRARIAENLQVGDTVGRHVLDSDVVLCNRQPSLHRMSIMAHKVRVIKSSYDKYATGNALGLNPAVTEPYNADFDGDEQNIYFLPGTCQLEIFALAGVKNHILTPKDGSAIIRLVQDGLLGMHLASIEGTTTNRRTFSNLQMFNMNFDPVRHLEIIGKERIETRDLINVACPEHVSVETKGFSMVNSRIQSGSVNKAAMSGVIERVFHNDGPTKASDTINSLQWMMIHWLMERGATMGVKDIIIPPEVRSRIDAVVSDGIAEIDAIYENARNSGVQNTTMLTNERFLETMAINVSSRIIGDVEGIIDEAIGNDNNLKQIIVSGAKGKARNLIEICALVGQQLTLSDGSRTNYSYNGRTLPHFQKGDDGALARGFIKNSLSRGLNPQEYAFYQSSGRDGLISTAVKTSETGYSQRKLIKAGENCSVHYDGTVRTSDGSIISMLYGSDGFEGARVVNVVVPHHQNGDLIAKMKSPWKQINETVVSTLKDGKKYQFAFDVENLIRIAVAKHPATSARRKVSDKDLFASYERCCETLVASKVSNLPNRVGSAMFAWWLCPSVLSQHRIVIGKDAMSYIESECAIRYMASIVSPGTAVGVIAAQSIGEPTTQLTLNQFHSSGSGKSTGIVKLTELLSGTHPKQSVTTMFFKEDKNSKEAVQDIEKMVRRRTLRDIATGCRIMYDNDGETPGFVLHVDIDRTKVIHMFSGFNKIDPMSIVDISAKNICETELSGEMTCTTSFMTDENLSLRFMRTKSDDIDDVITSLRTLEESVLGMVVSGYEDANGSMIELSGKDNWTLIVKGLVLQHMLCVEGVDVYNTISDDVIEVYETLGIEAARSMLIEQIGDVMERGVAERHIALLADIMTRVGVVMSINRHGINRQDGIGPLAKASFEETVDILVTAAARGEVDNMQGVSASIMLGQLPKVGTGVVKTSINMDMIVEDDDEGEDPVSGSDSDSDSDHDDGAAEGPSGVNNNTHTVSSERRAIKMANIPNFKFD